MRSARRVIVDMDGILADFMNGLWDRTHKVFGYRGDTAKVTDWHKLSAGLPIGVSEQQVSDLFMELGFFANLAPMPGAVTAMKALHAEGYEIVVASTPCSAHSIVEKIRWMKRWFPFLDPKNVFIGHKKHMLAGDVLIDDGYHNAEAFRNEQPGALICTIAYPYNNAGPVYDVRADGWNNPEFAWGRIVQAVVERLG